MIRSHSSHVWRCCETDWPKEYRYCGWCGNSVLTADRIVMRLPIHGGGDIAVVANADVNAETWAMLAEMTTLTASAFKARAEQKEVADRPNTTADAVL